VRTSCSVSDRPTRRRWNNNSGSPLRLRSVGALTRTVGRCPSPTMSKVKGRVICSALEAAAPSTAASNVAVYVCHSNNTPYTVAHLFCRKKIIFIRNVIFIPSYRWNEPKCQKKIVHQTHDDNLDYSWRIFEILSPLERKVNFQQNPYNTGTLRLQWNLLSMRCKQFQFLDFNHSTKYWCFTRCILAVNYCPDLQCSTSHLAHINDSVRRQQQDTWHKAVLQLQLCLSWIHEHFSIFSYSLVLVFSFAYFLSFLAHLSVSEWMLEQHYIIHSKK